MGLPNKTFSPRAAAVFSGIFGFIFLAGGIGKLVEISSFEFLLVVQEKLFDWNLVPYFSRIIISIEVIAGLSFFIQSFRRPFAIPISLLLLTTFSVHLIFTLATAGNNADCGCFGSWLPMSSLTALVKNIVLIGGLFFLNKGLPPQKNIQFGKLSLVFGLILLGVFSGWPVKKYVVAAEAADTKIKTHAPATREHEETTVLGRSADSLPVRKHVDTLRHQDKPAAMKEEYFVSPFSEFRDYSTGRFNPDSGLVLLTLFSLDCEHCLHAAKSIAELSSEKQKNRVRNLSLLLGDESQVNDFFQSSGFRAPYKMLSPQQFFPFLRESPPRIILLKNGKIIGDWSGNTFSARKLMDVLHTL